MFFKVIVMELMTRRTIKTMSLSRVKLVGLEVLEVLLSIAWRIKWSSFTLPREPSLTSYSPLL